MRPGLSCRPRRTIGEWFRSGDPGTSEKKDKWCPKSLLATGVKTIAPRQLHEASDCHLDAIEPALIALPVRHKAGPDPHPETRVHLGNEAGSGPQGKIERARTAKPITRSLLSGMRPLLDR